MISMRERQCGHRWSCSCESAVSSQVRSSGGCCCGGGSGAAVMLASAGELLGARVTAIGEQAVVPDAVEALGQDVHEEPAHELARLERHGCVPVRAFEAVVLIFERDAVRVGGDQATVGDGDAMGVAGQVGQHLPWPCERTLGIDEPVRLPQRCQVGLEGYRVGEMLMIAEET